ncbi:MAG: lysophospholipid acyltransferase family protein [Pseudomonadota bacterium]
MVESGAAPREISYSFSARGRVSKAVIKTIENVTGRPRLLRLASGYENEIEAGRDFWEVMQERYEITLDITKGSLANIPSEGPLVVVANHPYGILDGLSMGRILSMARGDFRIIAHVVFRRAEDLKKIILPIDFGETKEAMALNIRTRKEALSYLGDGGAVGIFPGGTVATAPKPFGMAMDPPWKTFTARMIAKSGAQVVPIYFEGTNSRLFQIAGHLNETLRTAMMISEFDSRVGTPTKVRIGTPLPHDEIQARASDGRALMSYLKAETYKLSPKGEQHYPDGLYLG